MVELTVVVMVILLIVAIAIPNMMEARMKAHEAAAVASIHTIDTAEALYTITYPDVGYAGSLPVLGRNGTNCSSPGKSNSCIIGDDALVGGFKDGYSFAVTGDGKVPDASYTASAMPVGGAAGRCSFSGDQSGLVRGTPVNSGVASKLTFAAGSPSTCGT